MKAYKASRCRTIEHAALLWSLREVPEASSEGPILPQDPRRVLTFEQEKQLADDLAFLASSSDNPDRIKAVCVEESTADKMVVKIASNTRDANMTTGFKELFSIMKTGRNPGTTTAATKTLMLMQIVQMRRNRILCRLRSCHGKSDKHQTKAVLARLLLQTISQCQASPALQEVLASCESFAAAFEELENAATGSAHDRLLVTILSCASKIDTDSLRELLTTTKKLCPSTVAYLPRAIAKLTRYSHIAANLTNACRRTHLCMLRSITIQAIDLTAVKQAELTSCLNGFKVVARNMALRENKEVSGSKLQAIKLKYDHAFKSARWKVHAEIQLLVHYQLHPVALPPRVIASNKSACYLCSKFIKLHGQHVIPRSHGRLYHKWTLPSLDLQKPDPAILKVLTNTLLRLNEDLVRNIHSVARDHSQHRAPSSESVAILYQPWSSNSTVRSLLVRRSQTLCVEDLHCTVGKRPPSVQTESASTSQISNTTLPLLNRSRITLSLAHTTRFAIYTDKIHFEFEVPAHDAQGYGNAFHRICVEVKDNHASNRPTIPTTEIDVDGLSDQETVDVACNSSNAILIVCRTVDHAIWLTLYATGRRSNLSWADS